MKLGKVHFGVRIFEDDHVIIEVPPELLDAGASEKMKALRKEAERFVMRAQKILKTEEG